MADLSDVTSALGQMVAAALYPTPPAGDVASPVAGLKVRIAAGWPDPKAADDAMTAGKVLVSIYPRPSERNTTRYPTDWREMSHEGATYALTVNSQTITVTGSAPNPYRPQNVAVLIEGAAYTIQTAAGQTAADVADALLTLILVDYQASRVGSVITVDDARIGEARVGATGVITRELRRQEREFQIIIWAPTPEARDAVTQPVDLALAQIERFDLPDGYSARLRYKSTMLNDFQQKQGIFRRDLFYTVEYATTQTDTATEITVSVANYADEFGNPISSVEA